MKHPRPPLRRLTARPPAPALPALLLGSPTTLEDAAGRPTGPMYLTYAVRMITGTVVAALGVRFLKEWAGHRS
ncbi:hypothetical protein ACFYO9_31260 [Streptomyces sp. NPDC005863]|uniref:hypothetical protein n=1 Tax=unclassified Streptomyces TaxID=2593676 RepID=UPI0033C44BF4